MYDVDCFFCGYGITAHREQEKKERARKQLCCFYILFREEKVLPRN
jgi:hypothetical protein